MTNVACYKLIGTDVTFVIELSRIVIDACSGEWYFCGK